MLRRFLQPGLLFLLTTVLYAPLASRYFASEDFLILRRLTEGPTWPTILAQWTGPWLETTAVLFYRPVATMILLGEVALFGPDAFVLVLIQVLVHGVCVLLALGIARRLLPGRGAAFAVAGLFALYPLHPNTVVWVAAFVNLYAAAFGLAAVWFHLLRRWKIAALCLALALGCYEAAAVLPLLLVSCDLASADGASRTERGKKLGVWAAYFGLLGGYLLLRGGALGALLGGYPQTRGRLLEAPLEVLTAAVALPVRTLLPLTPEVPLLPALVGSLALVGLAAAQRNRIALLGLAWTVIAQAPFGFVAVVPANGRFRYLAALGMAVAVVALMRSIAPARARLSTAVGGATVGACWFVLLLPNLAAYTEAGRLSQRLQAEILRSAAQSPGERIFITRYPTFVATPSGAPAAQVFTWGLRDAVGPPFVATTVDLYPLPPLGDGALMAVAEGQPSARILIWDRRTETLRPFPITPALQAATAAIQRSAATVEGHEMVLPPGAPAATALLLSGPGNPHRVDVTATPDAQGQLRIPLPSAFLEAQSELYGEPVYGWLETRGADGRLLGFVPAWALGQ